MENRTELGMNRTGMATSPAHMKKMQEITGLTTPSSQGDEMAIAEMRTAYIGAADPVGTVPPPTTVKGAVKSTAKMMKGQRPQVFLDKLGERLAFERSGTRLYEAMITKCEAPHEGPDVIDIDKLRHIQQEEAEHFQMLAECILEMGGDPTSMTPCANVAAVESAGLMQVVTDSRTTVNQSLHAILVAELADNAAWEELIVLAREIGQDAMAERFEQAAANEVDHLEHVKRWHQEATLAEAKVVAH